MVPRGVTMTGKGRVLTFFIPESYGRNLSAQSLFDG